MKKSENNESQLKLYHRHFLDEFLDEMRGTTGSVEVRRRLGFRRRPVRRQESRRSVDFFPARTAITEIKIIHLLLVFGPYNPPC